ncbi:hypothetical protein HanIR_Chr15g0748271 [Helianthus annuus]|nr:hypothetical protein HanIR_Chr15g0748271 [Helianthus annuus]
MFASSMIASRASLLCVCVSPFRLSIVDQCIQRGNGFVSGQATRKAEAGKISKHEQACIDNQHAFLPFAFDTFGCLAPVASGFLKRVQKAALAHATVSVGHSYVFS